MIVKIQPFMLGFGLSLIYHAAEILFMLLHLKKIFENFKMSFYI